MDDKRFTGLSHPRVARLQIFLASVCQEPETFLLWRQDYDGLNIYLNKLKAHSVFAGVDGEKFKYSNELKLESC